MATASRRRSVVRRVFALTALWAVGLSLAMAAFALWQYWRVSVRALDARVAADARALARQISLTDGSVEVEVPAEQRLAVSEGASYYGIYDAAGRLLDGDAPPLAPDEALRTGTWTVNGHREHRVDVVTQADDGNDRTVLAIVRVGQPLTRLRADLGRLATSLLVASLFAVALAAPLAVWLRREMARSVGQIDRTARQLAPGTPARIDPDAVDTEFTGVAERLNAAFDRLEQALERERRLTADASHELRTPVATLLAESEWALARPREVDEYRRALGVCARQGRRLKHLVESLLTLARIEAGIEPSPRERVALRPLVDDVVADLQRLAREHRVTVECDGDATVPGDVLQLGILVTNLVSNAIRHNREGGVVSIALRDDDVAPGTPANHATHTHRDDAVRTPHALLIVRDTGPGLDPTVAARVFERFWRAAPSRATREGGTGLGLAIAKAIVDAHEGRIDVATGPDGTTFTVRLPGSPTTPA